MKKQIAGLSEIDVYQSGNSKLEEGRQEGRLIENLVPTGIAKYTASHPLALAAEDTARYCEILKEVLINQFYKLAIAKSKHSDKTIKHADVMVKIGGVPHDFSIESSVTTDAFLKSYLTNIRMIRRGLPRGLSNPAEQVVCTIFMAQDGNGGVGMTEKWFIEIDPTGIIPESVREGLPGKHLSALIDSPLSMHPAMKDIRIQSAENKGPFGADNELYMISGKLGRIL